MRWFATELVDSRAQRDRLAEYESPGRLCDSATFRRGDRNHDTSPPTLRVLCRTLDQLNAVLDCGIRGVIVDFQDIREYREAVDAREPAGR